MLKLYQIHDNDNNLYPVVINPSYITYAFESTLPFQGKERKIVVIRNTSGGYFYIPDDDRNMLDRLAMVGEFYTKKETDNGK